MPVFANIYQTQKRNSFRFNASGRAWERGELATEIEHALVRTLLGPCASEPGVD